MTQWIAILIAVDAVVTAVVLWLVFRRTTAAAAVPTGFDIPLLWRFADETHARIGEYVRSHYSGSPETLPAVLSGLLTELEGEARSRNLPLSREMLKVLMIRSLTAHALAEPAVLRSALSRVA